MNRRKYVMSFWYDTKTNNNMFGFISKGYNFNYNVFIGDIYSKNPLKKIKGYFCSINEAREKIETEIRKTGIPYVVRTSVLEYYNGDCCTLRFEHFDAEGNDVDHYYEARGSLNTYNYYTTLYSGDILYAVRPILTE